MLFGIGMAGTSPAMTGRENPHHAPAKLVRKASACFMSIIPPSIDLATGSLSLSPQYGRSNDATWMASFSLRRIFACGRARLRFGARDDPARRAFSQHHA